MNRECLRDFRTSVTHLASGGPWVYDSAIWLCWEQRERRHGGQPRKTESPGKDRGSEKEPLSKTDSSLSPKVSEPTFLVSEMLVLSLSCRD